MLPVSLIDWMLLSFLKTLHKKKGCWQAVHKLLILMESFPCTVSKVRKHLLLTFWIIFRRFNSREKGTFLPGYVCIYLNRRVEESSGNPLVYSYSCLCIERMCVAGCRKGWIGHFNELIKCWHATYPYAYCVHFKTTLSIHNVMLLGYIPRLLKQVTMYLERFTIQQGILYTLLLTSLCHIHICNSNSWLLTNHGENHGVVFKEPCLKLSIKQQLRSKIHSRESQV